MPPFRYDAEKVAEINGHPRFRAFEADIETQESRYLCDHEHETPEQALDCDDARKARGLDPLPKPAPAGAFLPKAEESNG